RAAHAIDQRSGAIVMDVARSGPAEAAGVQIGDGILTLGAHAVEDTQDVASALGTTAPGTTQALRILRGGVPHELHVTIGERPHDDE
ncbi:MAG: PDZ domain-containing protein, partial [Candidatus Eremiobacteraeota bacterium]|nr:PDZ domain-containing protein [Candidatus Eremiobacteraeota bacterium]